MKKLLSIIPHCSTGGLPQVLVKRIELIKDDFDIYVVEFNNYSDHFIIQKNKLKKLLKPDHFFTLYDDKKEILNIINKIQPDLIHFEEMPELFNIDYEISKEIYKKNRNYKIFETTHSSDFNVDDKIFFPDKFLFVSQYNSFKFNKLGIPTEVIEYPVEKIERNLNKKRELMNKLGLDPNYKHVINIGLFTPRKNQEYAFEIARKLKNEKIKFHFIGNQADNFQNYWKPLLKNKPDSCVIWGERDDIDDFLYACDLFLFTSRGFRWNKELNPLVIKEALEYQIPQFLFPLDVYNNKYDTEETIHYLNGNVDIDANYLKNFLFPKEKIANQKYKIKAVHLLLKEDDRKAESILELEKLKDFGIEYVQHINKRYIEKPPKTMCARSLDVGRIGAYSLRGPHYGNYLSFKKAILTEFTEDVDFLIVFESDCKLNVSMQEFVDKIYQSCDIIINKGIYYMSFGDNRNLRTGEMVSDNHGEINDWMYITNKIIGIQSIMFPKFAYNFIKRAYDTTLWDVSDLMFNDMFKFKTKAIAPRLTTQIEGISTIQGENIQHFNLKNINNFLNDKNPNDIIIEYNEDDKRIHICLSDFYQSEISDISIVFKSKENDEIYKISNAALSSYGSTWVELYNYSNYNDLNFDVFYKNTFMFNKKLINNDNIQKKDIEYLTTEKIKEMIIEKNTIIQEEKIDVKYDINENKIFLPYSGNVENIKMFTVIKELGTGDILFKSNELNFNTNSVNWIVTDKNHYRDNPNFQGFTVDFIQNQKVIFTKKLKLKNYNAIIKEAEYTTNDKKVEINNNNNIINKNNNKDYVFIVSSYPDTEIKENITKKCINSLKDNRNNSIILTSHYPVSKDLQNSVDFYIYDSYNPLTSHSLYNTYWYKISEGKAILNLDKFQKKSEINQSLTVLNNIDNSIKFAKKIGYNKAICINYDFILNENNLKMIYDICKQIDENDKKGYFMKYKDTEDSTIFSYKSVFFIINTEFYSDVFRNQIRTPEEFNNDCALINSHNYLENYFYNKLSKYSKNLIIENTNEDSLFNNPDINIFSGSEYLSLLPIENDKNNFIVWFNSSNSKDNRRIEFSFNNANINNNVVEHSTHMIKEKSYYFKKMSLNENDNYTIIAKFFDSITNKLIDTQTFNINKNNYDNIIKNGIFIEK